MIVGSVYGWPAVADAPMDWAEFQMARQLLAEERVGRHVRAAGYAEDDEFTAAKRLLRG